MPSAPADRRVFNFPGWRDNPYVQILQSEITERGYELSGRPDFPEALIELTSPERRGVIHVQWTSPVTEWAENAKDARRRTDLFLDALYSAKRWGRKILWTVHNVLPHDAVYPKTALLLHERLAELADAIHVISPHTAELAAPAYAIPAEKVVEIPHSSYDGVYGPAVARDTARAELGVRPDSTAALAFGWIRPYKGLEHLAAASRIASEGGADIEVLLAGRPQGDVQHILDGLADGPATVTSSLRRILPEDVATWFCAADVLVLPYHAILNSGNMYLAATYGLPIVLPDEPHLVAEFGDEAWIRFFDRGRPDESIAALLADPWFRDGEVRAAARAFADSRPPQAMAARYADLIERLARG
ncbi:hypothetical protein [Microbacterium karelineae]|uniref:hypothetical protein n=1 Tax=Microbacterium karelineae TaxID=2654283 RepID=UPI0012E9C5AA|nr:hypothetical protein [Microbacterium karelineae]